MINTLREVSRKYPMLPSEIYGRDICLLLDDDGNILDITKKYSVYFHSIVEELSKAGSITPYFDLSPYRKLSNITDLLAVGQTPAPDRPGRNHFFLKNIRSFAMHEAPEAFYTRLPTVILAFCRLEKTRYFGVVRVLSTIPDIFLERPSGIIYVDQKNTLAGFNRTFYEFFKDSFDRPADLLGRPVPEFFTPSPAEIQERQLRNLPVPDKPGFRELFTTGASGADDLRRLGLSAGSGARAEGRTFHLAAGEEEAQFTLPAALDPADDLYFEAAFKSVKGDVPVIVIHELPEGEDQAAAEGYLAGEHTGRQVYELKRKGIIQTMGGEVSKEKPIRLVLYKIGSGLFLYENGARKLAYYDSYFTHHGKLRVSVGLRANSAAVFDGLWLGVRKEKRLRESITPVIRLKTAQQHYFILNRLNNPKISILYPDISAYVLENITEIQKQVDTLKQEYKALLKVTGQSAENFVGKSKAMVSIKEKAAVIADSDVTVLIQGETGTGKEILAQYVHTMSRRKEGPFIKVDCSTIPRELMESELFGHEKGSFTGAIDQKIGKFEQADGGTLFLDEVGNLTLETQAKLLQFLQDHQITRVGGAKSIPINVRIIVASNVPLYGLVERGQFRSDLFYRIDVVRIHLPPLAERREDLGELCRYFIATLNVIHNKNIQDLTPQAYEKLFQYAWPGNIRELRNTIERAVIFCDRPLIEADMIAFSNQGAVPVSAGRKTYRFLDADPETVRALFEKHKGVVKKVAGELNVTTRAVYYFLKKKGLTVEDMRRSGSMN